MPVPDFSPGEVLTAAAMDSIGLWLVKTQTIGAGVSSVTVTGAFSADYDNYKIVISGGVGSAAGSLALQLGATTTGYYAGYSRVSFSTGAAANLNDNNAASFVRAGGYNTGSLALNLDVLAPFLTVNTAIYGQSLTPQTTSSGGAAAGFLNDSTSYTAFTLLTAAGQTITGGTIRVYGYRN